MTIQLAKDDRIYKIIEAVTFGKEIKRFISKIDKNNKITVYTYIYSIEDINEDGTIASENKRMGMLLKDIEKDQFDIVIDVNRKVYPGFKIIYEKNYEDKSIDEAVELMNLENSIKADVPIKNVLDEIKKEIKKK